MAIRREELVHGGKAYLRTRHVVNGAAAHMKRHRVTIRDWDGGAARIEREDGTRVLVPFRDLEPDPEFLAEYHEKQAEKRERIGREREQALREAKPLTYTLADKLAQDEEAAVAVENEPDKRQEQRQEALRAIEALKQSGVVAAAGNMDAPSPPPPPKASGDGPPFDYTTAEGKLAAAKWAQGELDRGRDFAGICATLRLSRATLPRWIERYKAGGAFTMQGRKPGAGLGKLVAFGGDTKQREECVRAVVAGELTPNEAAEMYGVSRTTVRKAVDAFRQQHQEQEQEQEQPAAQKEEDEMGTPSSQYTPAQKKAHVDKWNALQRGGITAHAAAKKVGITKTLLYAWRRDVEAGRPLTPKPRVNLSDEQNVAMAQAILRGELTPEEAEVKFGVRRSTTYAVVRRYKEGAFGDPRKLEKAAQAAPAPQPRPTLPASPPPPPPPPPVVEVMPSPHYVYEAPPRQQQLALPASAHLPPPPPAPHVPQPAPHAPQPEPYYNGAQAVIDQLRSENVRLRAQVKSLLAALSHGNE